MTLHELNTTNKDQLRKELFKCCGSTAWVDKMMKIFPVDDLVELLEDAEEKWFECNETDWKQAFSQHPEIGDVESLKRKFSNVSELSAREQAGIKAASEQTLEALAEGNKLYRNKFGYIFIVCATGKSAEEILGLLYSRLPNTAEEEIKIAADEQNKITKIRLEKLVED